MTMVEMTHAHGGIHIHIPWLSSTPTTGSVGVCVCVCVCMLSSPLLPMAGVYVVITVAAMAGVSSSSLLLSPLPLLCVDHCVPCVVNGCVSWSASIPQRKTCTAYHTAHPIHYCVPIMVVVVLVTLASGWRRQWRQRYVVRTDEDALSSPLSVVCVTCTTITVGV